MKYSFNLTMNSKINHIAIIMDGNRRFAKKNGEDKLRGHQSGTKKLYEVLEWCKDENVDELTVYAFSIQNFKRDEDEKRYLFDLFEEQFQKLKKDISKINKRDFIKKLKKNAVTGLSGNDLSSYLKYDTDNQK